MDDYTVDEAYEKAVELQKSEGYTFVHPFDDEDVMEGQGTIALEIMEELPDVDYILVQQNKLIHLLKL